MIQQFSFPTSIQFGEGCIGNLPSYLKANGIRKPLIVTDKQISHLEFFDTVVKDLGKIEIHVQTFDSIHANPVKSDVLLGSEFYKAQNRDCVIGLGGGAAMDVARAVTLKIHHNRDLFDYDELEDGTKYITEPMPLFITVPTTSGTGSEVGRAAIISEDLSKRKRILFHPKLMAKQVFADPVLTYQLPPSITAATGMDALTHNLEAFVSKGWHPMCEGIALQGIRLIVRSIEKAVNDPNPQSRSDMMMGSLMGAVAFQKGLGIVHSLSHPLSTLVDMHHGLANAINLPYGVEYNYQDNEELFEPVGSALGLKQVNKNSIVQLLLDLNNRIGLPTRLQELKVTRDLIEPLTDLALQDFCLPSNPKTVTRQDFRNLYSKSIG